MGMKIAATGGSKATGTAASAGSNGQKQSPAPARAGEFEEIGTLGMGVLSGYIQSAYNAELYWPTVYPLYNRLRRSDPEISVVRQVFSAIAAGIRLEFQLDAEKPSDDDKRAQEFGQGVLAEIEGGPENFVDTLVSQVPFMGWGWWNVVPGLRRKGWRPPDQEDPWRSSADDGLIGIRRLAWRDHSSFYNWDIDDATGRVRGMKQLDTPNPFETIPLDRSVHITFGDSSNPEGLTPLEAVWRLERIKYGLEVVQGIGYEHAAGYLDIKSDKDKLTADDKTNIKAAARAIMTAQEGNYAAWPAGLTGELKDVPFSAAASILEAVRYYGLLKLALYNMQWVGLSTISDTGSFAAMQDSTAMWIVSFNAMMRGFVRQLDSQFGRRLFEWNREAFPGMTQRPRLVATPVEKFMDLGDLGTFLQAVIAVSMPLGDEDYLAIRKPPARASGQSVKADQGAAQDKLGEMGRLADSIDKATAELKRARR